MKIPGPAVAALAGIALAGNAVPTTPGELTRLADLVADVQVAGGETELQLTDGASALCFEARVGLVFKGKAAERITDCRTEISEMDPPRVRQGQGYRMYLLRSPTGIYSPFSHAGFVPLPGAAEPR